jgi:hypothetical protein
MVAGDGRVSRRATIVAILVALATAVATYLDDQSRMLDREAQQRSEIEFARLCEDPASAAALVRRIPSAAGICPAGLRQLLSIATDEVHAETELIQTYLDRLVVLYTAKIPDGDITESLGALHRDQRYAIALSDMYRRARRCEVVFSANGTPAPQTPTPGASFWDDWQRVLVLIVPGTTKVTRNADGTVVIEALVVDTIPSCMVELAAQNTVPRFTGTTALSLTFGVGSGPTGKPVWLLDTIVGCPVQPDPILAEPLRGTYSLTRRQSVRTSPQESFFAYSGSACFSPSPVASQWRRHHPYWASAIGLAVPVGARLNPAVQRRSVSVLETARSRQRRAPRNLRAQAWLSYPTT